MKTKEMWKKVVSAVMAAVLGLSLVMPFGVSEEVQAAESVDNAHGESFLYTLNQGVDQRKYLK